jgi:predicted metal-dependent hydrolase
MSMIAEKAYLELYPDAKIGDYNFSLKYSDRFNHYNANIRKRGKIIILNLSKRWETIGEDVKIGLIQVLLNKILRTRVTTQNTQLYEIFLKKIHIAVPKIKSDPILEASFDRVNEKYFYGMIERPNLKWGQESTRKLGSYEYGSDTILMSKIFMNANPELLDCVMHHEMLHKKHKFHTTNGRSYHHTRAFHNDEKRFENQEEVERRISAFARNYKKSKRIFRWF